ncbi:MAG: phospho-sugar mutase [Planctomycetaceae bacterium]|nr:phospho-sugar mutase [Planctomycetaceae bacterium]
MSETLATAPVPHFVGALEAAVAAGKLSDTAAFNIKRWLAESGYAPYAARIQALIVAGRFDELDALFWEVLPFGTGGRRGPMSDFGSATMNERTVAESANGLAVYLQKAKGQPGGKAVIAHDTRNRSREFAELSARVLAAHGLKVFLFDSHRSTPELSFAVRHLRCDVGLMISASHNPPADNGVKAYWSTGAQVLPPHDKGIIDCVYESNEIPQIDFDQAVADGKIELIGEAVDDSYIRVVRMLHLSSAREISVLFTPLHGVGETSVYRVLEDAGFGRVAIFEPQRAPDGNFTNVPNQLPNPELPAVFGPAIVQAKKSKAALILASDPDADRLGVVVRDSRGEYVHLSGNRIGALLADYICRKRRAAGTLGPQHFVVETLVTSPLIASIAKSYKIRATDNLLVGFKYIAQVMDRDGPERFVFGAEESLGYLAGSYCRDKDAAIAALYLCEFAAELAKQQKTLLDRLDEMYLEHGYHLEAQRSEACQGPKGKALIARLMDELTSRPPTSLAGVELVRVRDYRHHEIRTLPENWKQADLPEPQGDLMFFESAKGDSEIGFAARPSGTEPKIKFYFFAKTACPAPEALGDIKTQTEARLRGFQNALSAWVQQVWAAG